MAFSETLRIIIDANTRGFVAATKQAADSTKRMDSSISGVKQRISSFSKVAAVGLAGVGVAAIAMGDDFVRAAEESNKVSAQTDAVLKSMGLSARVSADQIADLAAKLSAKAGIDDEVIQSGENVLLTFKSVAATAGQSGGAFDRATRAALDMSVALGQDMQSSIVQVGKALNDPIRGLTALRRVGVQFTAQQEDQIKAMVAAGDQAGAMNLILKELERQFGGSAEAQATASGKLSVAWENLKETLGEKLLPVVERFSDWAIKTGIPALEAMIVWVSRNKTVLLGIAVAVATVVIPTFVAWAAATIAATWPLLAIGAAVGVLAVLVVKHFDTIRKAFTTAFNWLKTNWPLLLAIITGPIGLAVLAIVKHWDTIRRAFQTGVDFVVSIWRTGWDTVWRVTQSAWQTIAGFFGSLPGRFQGFFAGATKWLLSGGKNIMRGLWQGIRDIWDDIVKWFKRLPGRILGILGIHSPPGWAISAGKWIMRGITKGLGLGVGSVMDFMGNLAGRFTGALADAWGSLTEGEPGWTFGALTKGMTSVVELGKKMASAMGWGGGQWSALFRLWQGESGWNPSARNPSSGAYGIPQALPPGKMGPAAQASNTNLMSRAAAQIAWGLSYIRGRYGSPANALAKWQSRSPHWYATGGVVPGPVGAAHLAVVHGGEAIFRPDQARWLARAGGSGTTVNYSMTFNGPTNSTQVIEAIKSYERSNGSGWRN